MARGYRRGFRRRIHSIRFADGEWAMIEKLARTADMGASEFVRRVLVEHGRGVARRMKPRKEVVDSGENV